jgi:CHAT domain-containing protein
MPTQLRECEELRIHIASAERGGYRVRSERRPNGAIANGEFVVPFDEVELESFVHRVGLPRRDVGRSRSSRMEEARRFGSRLFAALMCDGVGRAFTDARASAEAQGRGLRVTLFLSDAPELMRLPWEFLYERPVFLAQSLNTPVVRGVDLPRVRSPEALSFPLRILGIASAPAGAKPLDAAAERAKLERALHDLTTRGVVEIRWLDQATLSALELAVASPDELHVLHYIGHGGYDELAGGGVLVMEKEDGTARRVSGQDLCPLLYDKHGLRLVVLNSCEGARTSAVDPFSGVAASLVECGVQAVIGMQFEITDDAAITFSERLYSAVASGLPADAAVGQTRKAIFAAGYETEFGTPVLYVSPGGTELFAVKTPLADARGPDTVFADDAARWIASATMNATPQLEVEGPEPLVPGAAVVMRVSVTTRDMAGADDGLDGPQAAADLELMVLVNTTEHFEMTGPTLKQLRVHPGQPQAEPVTFDVRIRSPVDRSSQPAVTALLLHEGRPIGEVRRTLTIGYASTEYSKLSQVVSASGAPVRLESAAVAPDMTIQVVRAPDGDHWLCSVSSPLLEELIAPDPQPWLPEEPIGKVVEECVKAFTARQASTQQRRDALIGAGRSLFRISPQVFQQALWRLVDERLPVRTLLVVTSETEFPWELLVPNRGFEAHRPLGVEYVIGRWITDVVLAPPQRMLLRDPLILAPQYSVRLVHSEEEAELVRAAMGGRRLSPVTYANLESSLGAGRAELIHFVGHGRTGSLLLESDEILPDINLEGMRELSAALARDRPLVFLNASETGRMGGSSPGGGLVRPLIRLGAGAVIAPTWNIKDAIAHELAKEFYSALAVDPHRAFADIVRDLRRRAYEDPDPEDSWAAYVFFGDPLAARAA